jgi:hypothetical protein
MMQIRLDKARGILSPEDEKLWREMFERGVVRSNVYHETEQVLDSAMDFNNFAAKAIDPTKNPYSKALFSSGGYVEDIARGSMYLWRRKAGDTAEQAMKHVSHWHIDYLYGLTQYERNLRDYALPFWTFTSRNMPLTLETLAYRTKLLAIAGHGMTAVEEMFGGPEPDFPLSGWMASATPLRIKYDPETGTYSFQALDGMWSFTDFNKFNLGRALDELVGMINPVYTAPYEVIKNHKTWPNIKAGQEVERPGDKFKLLGQEKEFPFDKRVEHILRQFRPLNEADKWLEAASKKYGDTDIERAVNVFNRILLGKVYPTTKEQQLRWYKGGTNEQLKGLRRAIKLAEEAGNLEEAAEYRNQIDNITRIRKELGIK